MAGNPEAGPNWWTERMFRYVLGVEPGWAPTPAKVKSVARSETRMHFLRGRVIAEVPVGQHGQGSTAMLKVKPWGEREWRRAVAAIAGDAAAASRLLSGTPGPELEAVLAAENIPLFPEPTGSRPLKCDCREPWQCRHMLALAVHGAALVEANPFLWLAVLGKERAELLAAVQAYLSDHGKAAKSEAAATATGFAAAGPDIDPDRFWTTPEDPDAIAFGPGASAAPDALLRLLGPLPLGNEVRQVGMRVERTIGRGEYAYTVWEREPRPVEDVLRAYVTNIGQSAVRLARGEAGPVYGREALPGRLIVPSARLAAEVAEAVLQEGAPLSLEALQRRCPTAAALTDSEAHAELVDALDDLPDELTVLAGYVGVGADWLAGSEFRHVVTFDEWRTGHLAADADWVRALAAIGHRPPYTVQAGDRPCRVLEASDGHPAGQPAGPDSLMAALRPEVGDELRLAVVDPAGPRLAASLRRRADRDFTDFGVPDEGARSVLLNYLRATREHPLPEAEAVAVLLAEGCYREGRTPDPVWLIPTPGEAGLYALRTGRMIGTESWWAFAPTFGRETYRHWQGRPALMRWFTSARAQAGGGQRALNEAVTSVDAWCRYSPGEQDVPGRTPPLAALLNFLWTAAPLEYPRLKLPPEALAANLGAWFAFLGERVPALQAAYAGHVAACGLVAAFLHRVQTRPRGQAEMAAWVKEGYRWMGPGQYFCEPEAGGPYSTVVR
ncbi:MAG TPA: hypothetical protein VGK74_12745 [Symbiobacteriaceae bacterium]|jgi:uncharacterized Zn finger protein